MSNEIKTFVGYGCWDEWESSLLLVTLDLSKIKRYVEDAKEIFEKNPDLLSLTFPAPDPVEIVDDGEKDWKLYKLVPYNGEFEYEEMWEHKPRYSTFRIDKYDYITYRTHPKHWDATISFEIGNLLE